MGGTVRSAVAGATRYLGSVLVGVLLAPVLPDVAVDLFGGGPGWGDALLRVGALLVVALACVVTFQLQVRLAARRSRAAVLTGIGTCEVLVLPIGLRCVYRPPGRRTGPRSIPEWLVDHCRPDTVVVVSSPQIGDVEEKLGRGLAADGIRFASVQLPDVSDPKTAIPEAERRISDALAALHLTERRTYVDTTGGNVIMSLAMLRVGVVLGAECTYLASEYRGGEPVPGTQVGRAFAPAALFGPTA